VREPETAADITEIDLFADAVLENPYGCYAALRDNAPATYLPAYDAWALARYEDVRGALMNWATFNSGDGVFLTPERNREVAGRSVLTTDPPKHDEMRKVYQEHISLRPLREVVPQIDRRADELVASLVRRGAFDAVTELAKPFSVGLVGDLVGFAPEGRDLLLTYSDAVFNTQGPLNDRHRAGLEHYPALFAYIAGLVEPGGLTPGGWGHAMLAGAKTGRYPLEWARAGISSFIVAGLDTTMNAIGSAVWLLAEHPEQWRTLRDDPSLIPGAFAEVLRYESPIQWFSRRVSRDCEVGDVGIEAGGRVMLLYGAANRDERAFTEPDVFDIRRRGRGHLGFGFGVHGCVGQALAKAEGGAILAALVRHVERLEVTSTRRHLNNVLRGFAGVDVEVERDRAPTGGI
jgi:cytochrome P450